MKANISETLSYCCEYDDMFNDFSEGKKHLLEILRLRRRAVRMMERTNEMIDYHLTKISMDQHSRIVFVPQEEPGLIGCLEHGEDGRAQITFANNVSNESPGILAMVRRQ